MTNFCLKNQTFCVKGPEKKSKFSKISLEKSIILTRIHDLPRFQTRLTPLDILRTNAIPNLNLLGPLSMFKYIVLENLQPFRTFSRAARDTPVHLWQWLQQWMYYRATRIASMDCSYRSWYTCRCGTRHVIIIIRNLELKSATV